MSSLNRVLPAQEGISAQAIINLLNGYKNDNVNIHSVMLVRHGNVIAECYKRPYKKELNHIMFSLSKSFTSIAVGIAVDEGLLSVDDYVVSFFPEYLPSMPCENMMKMKIKHLLTMSTGHTEEPKILLNFISSDCSINKDWVKTFLHSYVEFEPGSNFIYNTAATYMLSAIVQKLTNETVFDYLTPRLFKPLGIENAFWEKSYEDITTGGWGLNLTTEDMAKFGVFLQNHGVYNGKRLLSEEWIKAATSKQVNNEGGSEWCMGYGYQFWRCALKDTYRADGAYGQICFVDDNHDLVVAVTGGIDDITYLFSGIYNSIIPCIDEPINANDEAEHQKELERIISSLEYDTVHGEYNASSYLKQNQFYKVSSNISEITELMFNFDDKTKIGTITICSGEHKCDIKLGYNEYIESETHIKKEEINTFVHTKLFERCSSSYAWDGDTLKIKIMYITTPFCCDISIRFIDMGFVMKYKQDKSFLPIDFEALGLLML